MSTCTAHSTGRLTSSFGQCLLLSVESLLNPLPSQRARLASPAPLRTGAIPVPQRRGEGTNHWSLLPSRNSSAPGLPCHGCTLLSISALSLHAISDGFPDNCHCSGCFLLPDGHRGLSSVPARSNCLCLSKLSLIKPRRTNRPPVQVSFTFSISFSRLPFPLHV